MINIMAIPWNDFNRLRLFVMRAVFSYIYSNAVFFPVLFFNSD